RLCLGCISAVSRLYLGCISATSRLYLGAPRQPALRKVAAGALAAGEGEVPLDGYSAAATRQPARQALAAKVAVIDDGNPDPNALAPQRVVITLRDGQQGEVTVADTFGAPANALSDEENVAKFRRCCAHGSAPVAPAQVDAVVAMVADLEAVTDMRHLVASMTPAARR
ncbi:MAG: hypothetical protein VXY90_08965, partial [Pseudomonadota bacterium]|nr:hypothetical protein [Pseudomonadota bacterium]